MGEKEIRQTSPGTGQVVAPPPPPMTTERPGTGAAPGSVEPAPVEPATPGSETLFKDGWSEGRDAAGRPYAIDLNGVKGLWDPASKRFVDPSSGKPFPTDWGTGHRP
jgi:hypothetical protein